MNNASNALKPLGNIHDLALRWRDAEQTHWFSENILGLKLAAALSLGKLPGTEAIDSGCATHYHLGQRTQLHEAEQTFTRWLRKQGLTVL